MKATNRGAAEPAAFHKVDICSKAGKEVIMNYEVLKNENAVKASTEKCEGQCVCLVVMEGEA
jgi:hypothetical protein